MTLSTLSPEELATDIPTPLELASELPLTKSNTLFVNSCRQTVRSILQGLDNRLLMIVGPCSIHHPKSVYAYGEKFARLAKEVSERFFLVMRTYYEKPRTKKGWKGLIFDPNLDGSHDIGKGLRLTRELLVNLTEMGVPVGCEFLEIYTSHYFSDLITWGCIGARTCTSQPHRQLASSLPMPIGFKNSTDGNVDHAIHGVLSASTPHVFLGSDFSGQMTKVQTEGNSHCHIILRGGKRSPNYDPISVENAIKKCTETSIRNQLIIDCSHDNCAKRHELQIPVFKSVIDQVKSGNRSIVGLMLESHLSAGNQPFSPSAHEDISITDPCLDWATTEKLIREAYLKY
ncbi:MAG: Phospho-2-dehydro-3-deoxyheptonate aldolase, Tyr-sensitive [Chlamydiae bacterium]|nr:Phospho-2-dehydro-3-deoxyheptonate aldolase, Tyr-sensitive [Chlamydiota bacterium]